MARNYKREYAIESKQRRAARSQRNQARQELIKKGVAKVGDGLDVGHKRAISKGGSNSLANLEMQTKSSNRSFDRANGRKMASERSVKERKAGKPATVAVKRKK